MKRINIRESLIQMDRDTSCEYDLTTMYESLSLTEDKKKELVKYIDAYDIDATNKFLGNEVSSQGLMEFYDDDFSDEELASIQGEDTKNDNADGLETEIKTEVGHFMAELGFDTIDTEEASFIEVNEVGNNTLKITVEAEVYDDIKKLARRLNTIVKKYDAKSRFKPVDSCIIEAYVRLNPSVNEDIDATNDTYTFVSSKSVPDSDGFQTDYTWYKASDGTNVFVFGDNDIYKPEDGYFDHVEEDDSAAQEWFDSYRGLIEGDDMWEKLQSLEEVTDIKSANDDMEDKVLDESVNFNLEEIKAVVGGKVSDYLHNELGYGNDFINDYVFVEVTPSDNDRVKVEVRAELSYDEMFNLASALDKVISVYDSNAYFDNETSGIISAYIDPNSEEGELDLDIYDKALDLFLNIKSKEDLSSKYKEFVIPNRDKWNERTLNAIYKLVDDKIMEFESDGINESISPEYKMVEYTYDGDETSDYLGHVRVRTDSDKVALRAAEKYIMNKQSERNPRHFKISDDKYNNVDVIDSDGYFLTKPRFVNESINESKPNIKESLGIDGPVDSIVVKDYNGDIHKELWDDAEVYMMTPDDPHYRKTDESINEGTLNPNRLVQWAVGILFDMDRFVMDVYDNESWLTYGVGDGEFEETTTQEAKDNYVEHDWLVIDPDTNDFSVEDFTDFLSAFKSATSDKSDYDQEERQRIIDEAQDLLSNINTSTTNNIDESIDNSKDLYEDVEKRDIFCHDCDVITTQTYKGEFKDGHRTLGRYICDRCGCENDDDPINESLFTEDYSDDVVTLSRYLNVEVPDICSGVLDLIEHLPSQKIVYITKICRDFYAKMESIIKNYTMTGNNYDESLKEDVSPNTIKDIVTKFQPSNTSQVMYSVEVDDDIIKLCAEADDIDYENTDDNTREELDMSVISNIEKWASSILDNISGYDSDDLDGDWFSGMSLFNDETEPGTYNGFTFTIYKDEPLTNKNSDKALNDDTMLCDLNGFVDANKVGAVYTVKELKDIFNEKRANEKWLERFSDFEDYYYGVARDSFEVVNTLGPETYNVSNEQIKSFKDDLEWYQQHYNVKLDFTDSTVTVSGPGTERFVKLHKLNESLNEDNLTNEDFYPNPGGTPEYAQYKYDTEHKEPRTFSLDKFGTEEDINDLRNNTDYYVNRYDIKLKFTDSTFTISGPDSDRFIRDYRLDECMSEDSSDDDISCDETQEALKVLK